MLEFITFSLEERLFGISLRQLNKVIRAVAVTNVPDADGIFHGVFNYHGEVMPVINLRKRFSMPSKEISISDHFLIVDSGKHTFAIVVDKVGEVKKIAQDEISDIELSSSIDNKSQKKDSKMKSFLRSENGIIILYDLEALINNEIEIQLEKLTKILKKEDSI
jgi:purine-binding chemotaxis protein CheW